MGTVFQLKSSKEIIEITGISRATLNNYINYGLLSKPTVLNPGESGGPRQLGYFPDDAIQRVQRIQQLRQDGINMAEIVSRMRNDSKTVVTPLAPQSGAMPRSVDMVAGTGVRVTLDDIPHP